VKGSVPVVVVVCCAPSVVGPGFVPGEALRAAFAPAADGVVRAALRRRVDHGKTMKGPPIG